MMGSTRKKTATKPVPAVAEFFTRGGIRFARWKSSTGKSKTAKLTVGNDGADKIVVESSVWLGKYSTGDGRIVEKSTGCRDKQAAAAVVAEWERRAELVKSGIVSASEDRIAEHQATKIEEHFEAYGEHLQAKGCCKIYRENTRRHLDRLAADCRFSRLGDFDRAAVERCLAESSQ